MHAEKKLERTRRKENSVDILIYTEKKCEIILRNFVVLYHANCSWYKTTKFMVLYRKFIDLCLTHGIKQRNA